MAVALRLMKFGKKGKPHYRIVALDKRQKRDGAYLERVGTYDPMTEPAVFEVIQDRFDYWVKNGAQISEGLARLLKNRQPADETSKPVKEVTKVVATPKQAVTEAPTIKTVKKTAKKTAAPKQVKEPAEKSV